MLQNLASQIKERYNPLSISVDVDLIAGSNDLNIEDLEIDNVSQLPVQHKLIRRWFENTNITKKELDKIIRIHTELFTTIVTDDIGSMGNNWAVKKINFSNAFSYGEDNSVDFEALNGLVGIFSPNASGKSALLTTIMTGIFNMSDRVSRNNIGDLINKQKEQADIELYFSVDNREFVLRRQVTRQKKDRERGLSTVNLWEIMAGEEIALSGEATKNETERIIRSLVGNYMDHSMTTFGMQGKLTDFIDECDAGRIQYLSKFLGLDIVEAIYLAVKGECDGLKRLIKQYKEHDFKSIYKGYVETRDNTQKELDKGHKLKERISAECSSIKTRISDLNKLLKNIDSGVIDPEEIKLQIYKTDKRIEELVHKEAELSVEIGKTKTTSRKVFRQLKKFDIEKLKAQMEEYQAKITEIGTLKNKSLLLKKDISSAKRLTENLKKHDWFETDPNCKKCVFLSDAFQSKNSLENLNIEYDTIIKEMNGLSSDIEGLKESAFEHEKANNLDKELSGLEYQYKMSLVQRDKIKASIKNCKLTRNNQKALLDQYNNNEAAIKHNEGIKNEITKLEASSKDFEKKLTKLDRAISEQNVALGGIKQKIEDLGNSIQQLNDIEESFRLASMLKDALSKDGIQLQIIKKVVPRINMEIRKILSNVTEFDIAIEVDDETRDIEIYINDGSSKRQIDLGSGMEKTIGAIAIRAALANVSLIPRCNLFVIDEGFGTLDSDNLNSMNMFLGQLKSMFKIVLIISHVDYLQDIIDYNISINKDEEGFSQIDIK